MHRLTRIIEQIHEEASSCAEYAMYASEMRESDRSLADTYMSIAKQELEHFEKLEAQGSRLLTTYESEYPNDVFTREFYTYQKERALNCAAKAKIIMEGWR